MPPNRNARHSRNGEIPDNFIVNWRKPEACGGAKPLVRRPITACENCRTAKVRCNGQQDCHRCTARGLVCAYTSNPVLDRRSPAEDGAQPSSMHAASPAAAQDVTQEVPAVVNIDATAAPSDLEYRPGVDLETMTPADWTNGSHDHSIDHFDWGPVDSTVNEHTFDSLAQSAPLDLGSLQCMGGTIHQTFPQDSYNPLFCNNSLSTSSASRSPPSLSLHNHQTSSGNCLCRASLMLCLPKITSAMQDKRLDEVFKVTGEVFKCCQDIVDCKTDQVRCTDLLLIMAVLQETHPCFDHIAKSDLEDAVKVSFGGYEVSSNDANLRAMLVMDLVQRASTVLASISSKGQSMIDELGEPSCLAQANIAYLEATISHFRTIFQCVTRYIEEAVNKDGSVS